MGKIRRVLAIVILAFLFFWTLPYPFEVSKRSCAISCQKISDYTKTQHTDWSLFGGYHLVAERLISKASMEDREMSISKYYGVSYLKVSAFSLVSAVAGWATVGVIEYIFKLKPASLSRGDSKEDGSQDT